MIARSFAILFCGSLSGLPVAAIELSRVGQEVAGSTLDGAREGDLLGRAIASLDFNGDGAADLAVSARGYDRRDAQGNVTATNTGGIYVIYGRAGLDFRAFDLASLEPANGGDGSAGVIIVGSGANEQAGETLANAGDLNNDGIDDLLIGVPRLAGANISFFGGTPGGAYLIFGSREPLPALIEATELLTDDNVNTGLGVVLPGSQSGGAAGTDVAGVGDINADCLDDAIVGNRFLGAGFVNRPGFTYVLYGRASTAQWPAQFNLVNLQTNAADGTEGFTVVGDFPQNGLGSVLTGLGDFTGDQINDFFLGSPFGLSTDGVENSAGFIIPGRPSGPGSGFDTGLNLGREQQRATAQRLRGDQSDDQSGIAAANVGDVNGDGRPDLAVAANLADHGGEDSGTVYVLFGRPTGTELDPEYDLTDLLAANSGDGSTGFAVIGREEQQLGDALTAAGDVNGDGLADFAIGASLDDLGGNDAGAVYIVYGRDTYPAQISVDELTAEESAFGRVLIGESPGDQVGDVLGLASDVNRDSAMELALSSQVADFAGSNTGRVYLVEGSGQPLAFSGESSRAWYDPNRAGEGVLVEVGTLDGQPVLFVTWYTYRDGNQFWLAGGPEPFTPGQSEVTLGLIETSGTDFGDGFQASQVQTSPWGSVTVSLDACDRLGWRYTENAGESGELTFRPLLADQLGLAGCLADKGQEVDSGFSGAWWNPDRAGEGIVLDIDARGATPTAFFSWFTYSDGSPVWLVGSAPLPPTGGALEFELVATRGAQFGNAFFSADVVVLGWGNATMTLNGCDSAVLDYSGAFEGAAQASGRLDLVRFTDGLFNLPCVR